MAEGVGLNANTGMCSAMSSNHVCRQDICILQEVERQASADMVGKIARGGANIFSREQNYCIL